MGGKREIFILRSLEKCLYRYYLYIINKFLLHLHEPHTHFILSFYHHHRRCCRQPMRMTWEKYLLIIFPPINHVNMRMDLMKSRVEYYKNKSCDPFTCIQPILMRTAFLETINLFLRWLVEFCRNASNSSVLNKNSASRIYWFTEKNTSRFEWEKSFDIHLSSTWISNTTVTIVSVNTFNAEENVADRDSYLMCTLWAHNPDNYRWM